MAIGGQARQRVNAINPQHQLGQQRTRGQKTPTALISKLLCRINNMLGNAHILCREVGVTRPAYKMTSHLSLRENGQIIISCIVRIFLT